MVSRCAGAGLLLLLIVGAASLDAQTPSKQSVAGVALAVSAEEAAGDKLLGGGKPREAAAAFDRAAAAYRRSNDQSALARVMLKASRARATVGDLPGAARDAEQARRVAADDPALLLQILSHIARLATARSDFAGADAALRDALPLAERSGDAREQATVLRTLGILEERRGLQREALEHLREAIAAADRSGDATVRVTTRGSTAATLLGLSRYDEALAIAQEADDVARRAGVPALRAGALFQYAQANAHVWNLDRASDLWASAIDAYREAGSLPGLATSTKQSVETWFALGEFDRAADEGASAVDLLVKSGQWQFVAETAARVALSELRRGRVAEARRWVDRARTDLAKAPESRHYYVHNDLGIVEAEAGDVEQARRDFARVLDVAQRVGNVEYEWRARWGEGRVAIRENPADAIAPLERAIGSVERLRQTIPEAGLRASFMINRVGPYETLVEAHMATTADPAGDGVRRGLEVAERARSRALADLLAEARARISDPRVAAIRDEETAFGRRFSAAQQRVASAPNDTARAAARGELRDLEHEYETLVVRIRRDNPAYASLAHPRALSAVEIAATLDPDEALIEFLITDKQGYAWVVRRHSIHGYRIPGAKALEPQVRLLAALLAARDDRAVEQLGAQLYDTLLGPATTSLNGARRLTIVPDGVLQRLPFAILRSNDRWLVESHTIAMAPSATVLQYLRQSRPRAAQPLLALAVPETSPGHTAIFDGAVPVLGTLTHATDEVRQARRLAGAAAEHARTGAAATEAALKSSDASAYRIVHLAAHAIADEIVPRRSAVLLTPGGEDDGLLQVSEIANLSLNAELVVLAACHSNVGRLVRGEGMLSLSRAFMHGGARAVMATQWAIPDRETAWLMGRFYSALSEGLAPDEALRRAQLDAIASGGSRGAPATWAAFVMFGAAREPILEPRPRSTTWTLAVLGVATVGVFGVVAVWARRRRSGSLHAEAGSR